jgi:hypothetical protein
MAIKVSFRLVLVDELDFSAILTPASAKDPRGVKGFDPRMETKSSAQLQPPVRPIEAATRGSAFGTPPGDDQ